MLTANESEKKTVSYNDMHETIQKRINMHDERAISQLKRQDKNKFDSGAQPRSNKAGSTPAFSSMGGIGTRHSSHRVKNVRNNDSGYYNLPHQELLRQALGAVEHPQQKEKETCDKHNEFTPKEEILKHRKNEFINKSRGYRTKSDPSFPINNEDNDDNTKKIAESDDEDSGGENVAASKKALNSMMECESTASTSCGNSPNNSDDEDESEDEDYKDDNYVIQDLRRRYIKAKQGPVTIAQPEAHTEPFNAYIARSVGSAETERNPGALKAKDSEWDKLWSQHVWDHTTIKSYHNVMYEARCAGKYIHLGALFGICVEKGSELPDGDPRKKYKYRVVFQGNRVVDQNMDEAQFADLGSAPATTEAARLCILKGLLPGNKVEQADARQAYIQAKLGGTETWVEIPIEGWPPEWKVDGPPCKRPCARLIQALYGHPDSGTYWEKHAHARLLGMGFEPAAEAWPSCYIHKDSDIFLVLYVDDFLMSGPENLLKNMWGEIAKCLDIDEPAPMSLYLGCLHDESTVDIDGRIIRTMTFNQESFFTDKIERY